MFFKKKQPEKGAIVYIGFNRRMYATSVDMFLTALILLPFAALGPEMVKGIPPELAQQYVDMGKGLVTPQEFRASFAQYAVETHFFSRILINSALQMVLAGIAIVLFWVYRDATPGKMLFGMKIADAETLKAPTRKQYILRYVGYIVAGVPLFLGFLWIIFDPRKQGLHDKMAGTVVIANKPYDPVDEDKKFRRQTIIGLVFITLFLLWFGSKKFLGQ